MDSFLKLPDERKKLAYEQVSEKMGIPASYVEKDLWVCWVLNVLFTSPELSPHLTFRGGTSLSKAFGMIARFSEDIDLAIDRSWLGITEDNDPETAPNPSQLERRQKNLRQQARQKVADEIEPPLREALSGLDLETGSWSLELSDDENQLESARDPYCVFLNYPCLTGVQQTDYIHSRVKIELSAKAEGRPDEKVQISSFVAEHFPQVFNNPSFPVKVLSPARTFWEKAFIIHEENTAPESRTQKARLARHYYDLSCLAKSGKVTLEDDLFEEVKAHRNIHFRQSWVDYETITPEDLQIAPLSDEMLAQWQSDYKLMETMIYGDFPTLASAITMISNFIKTAR